jgi:bacillithiol system protein YtxJ
VTYRLRRSGFDCDNDSCTQTENGEFVLGNLEELRSIQELDEALDESQNRPVLFFKHSLTCPISTRAFRELQSYLNNADPRISYKLITVQTARTVSNEAASRLHLDHQSPQAILVRNGRELWNASHYDITASTLAEAIRNAD